MKSSKEMPLLYQNTFENYLQKNIVINQYKPNHFINIMKHNRGIINFAKRNDEKHIDLRNPLLVALGDSVTGGHFEMMNVNTFTIVQDLTDSYIEKFKILLHQRFPVTTPSIINSAIAGDTIKGMYQRMQRDVIVHQPDLVILNATLNWSENRGTLNDYKEYYKKVILEIKEKTEADILVLTPNAAIETDSDKALDKRVIIVRELVEEYQLPMVDIYKMWQDVCRDKDIKACLSNQENHPTPLAHTYMAKAMMQMFK